MTTFIFKFADVAIQPNQSTGDYIRRAVGFASLGQVIQLIDANTLAPNPRSAKRNAIVEGILGTLNDSPELFRYKSKGLLISSHEVEELQRNRFRLTFSKDFVDGVLDGGHNLFAIGLFVLSQVADPKDLKRVRSWEQLDDLWGRHREDIEGLEFDKDDLVAVELIYPPRTDQETQDAFDLAAFDISQARNANTQVKTEAFQNKLGFYDVLKEALPEELSQRVEWKPGVVEAKDAKPISVRDIVALAWIPLNIASEKDLLPIEISVLPQNIYRNKGECSDKFNTLMMHEEVTESIGGNAGQARQLVHPAVDSCLRVASDLPRLVDLIYEHFPRFYNDGTHKFGKRNVVKMYNPERVKELKAENKDPSGYTSIRPTTPYFQRTPVQLYHKYPEALIIPFVTGLSALMKVENGRVVWATDDIDGLVLEKLEKAAPLFDGQLDAYDWDPQRLAKSPSSHKQAASYYRVL
ncbi:hypothetical protein [Erythrobacter sp.]|uniref:hypothetical protein n=1 Tax=Erythrobacter sp. TaxID=1042 RepID=UPI001B1A39C1|nr:hypothetical protein [Erythrobacter sp.]MBO6526975.1 AIPR family protein [Erythrobacter sp.]MBO6528856.1 AIPR family protein [Erythrobacter sp.]